MINREANTLKLILNEDKGCVLYKERGSEDNAWTFKFGGKTYAPLFLVPSSQLSMVDYIIKTKPQEILQKQRGFGIIFFKDITTENESELKRIFTNRFIYYSKELISDTTRNILNAMKFPYEITHCEEQESNNTPLPQNASAEQTLEEESLGEDFLGIHEQTAGINLRDSVHAGSSRFNRPIVKSQNYELTTENSTYKVVSTIIPKENKLGWYFNKNGQNYIIQYLIEPAYYKKKNGKIEFNYNKSKKILWKDINPEKDFLGKILIYSTYNEQNPYYCDRVFNFEEFKKFTNQNTQYLNKENNQVFAQGKALGNSSIVQSFRHLGGEI